MKNWLFITLMGMVLLIGACGSSPTFRMYKAGYDFSLGSGSKAKYKMFCDLGDLNKILADTHLSEEMKDAIFKYNCTSERSTDKVNQVYASMTAEQRKDIKSAFKKYGYTVNYCPT